MGAPEQAEFGASAVALAQPASLVQDEVMDKADLRQGKATCFKRFGVDLTRLLPDMLSPQTPVCLQAYRLRATRDLAVAWGKIPQGQLLDFPGGWAVQDYAPIGAMQRAPLFEVPWALGMGAAKPDWLLNLGHQYSHNCGMACQIFDDYWDRIPVFGQPWETAAKGKLPSSLRALRQRVRGNGLVTDENTTDVLDIGHRFLRLASSVTGSFHESVGKAHLQELPRFCCDALLAEVQERS